MQLVTQPRPRLERVPVFLHGLLFLIVASSSLSYWQSTEYALNGNWLINYNSKQSYIDRVPAFQKAAKDVLAFLLLIGSLYFRPTNPKTTLKDDRDLSISYLICAAITSIAFIQSLYTRLPDFLVIASLRPIIFIISIFVFCHRHLHPYYLRWVLEAANLLTFVQVYYAVRQRNAAIIHNGVSWLDSGSARAVGLFTEPNAMGLFLAFMFYVNVSILPPNKFRPILLVMMTVGIFFTGSRASQLIILTILATTFYRKFWIPKESSLEEFFKKVVSVPLALLAGSWFYAQVNSFSGRGEGSSATGGRFDILLTIVNQLDLTALIFGKYLSYGSNVINVVTGRDDFGLRPYLIADSTPAWLIGQFGLVGIFGVLYVAYCLFRSPTLQQIVFVSNRFKPRWEKIERDQVGLIVYLFFSSTTIILLEFYAVLPLLIAVLFPWQIANNRSQSNMEH
jgi:hypothetical protein